MSKIDPNAPAFPVMTGTEANPNFPENITVYAEGGLSIRAQIASEQLAALSIACSNNKQTGKAILDACARLKVSEETVMAKTALALTDALIAELNKEGEGE
jgi:hypothetical protein